MVLGPYDALGHVFTVTVAEDRLGECIARTLEALGTTCQPRLEYSVAAVPGPRPDWYELRRDGEPVMPAMEGSLVLDWLAWAVNQGAIESGRQQNLLMHAAGVARDGLGVVLAAPMESGKTTTCTGLVRDGWSYLTDEAVAVDPATLRVRAFPKALTIDPGSQFLFPELRPELPSSSGQKWQVPPHSIRPGCVTTDVPVGLLLLPAYREGASTELQPLTPAQAVMELAQCTFFFIEQPERNLAALAQLARTAPCYRLVIGALDEAVTLVNELPHLVSA